MGRSVLILVLSLGLALVGGRPRSALAEGPSAAERKKAKKLIIEAGRSARRGDVFAKRRGRRAKRKAQRAYKRAALRYIEAFDLLEHPAIVLKLATVYQVRGEFRWARRGFRRYLEMQSELEPSENTRDAQRRLGELDALIEAHRASGKRWPEDANAELDPTAVFGFERKEEPVAEEPVADKTQKSAPEPLAAGLPAARPPTSSARSRRARWFKWGGLGTAGVGVVLLGVGIGFGASASSAASRLSSNDDPWDANDRNLISSGQSDADKMVLFTTLSAVTLVAGGALYYLGWRGRADAESADSGEKGQGSLGLVPTVGNRSAGLTLSGSF